MASKKIIIFPLIIFILAAVFFFVYKQNADKERTGATLDYQFWYEETSAADNCYDVKVYGVKNPDVPISLLEICDDRIKDIDFSHGMLSLTTRCGRRYTADVDKMRDFYDNNYCNQGSFTGGLYSSRVTLQDLLDDWNNFEKLIPVRPLYDNQVASGIWGEPTAVQDIGNNTLLVRIDDNDATHVALARLQAEGFGLLEFFEDQGPFTAEEWSQLQKDFGNVTDETVSYTVSVMREGEEKNFNDLTKVGENVFVENYWAP